jgi:hypothetical protein
VDAFNHCYYRCAFETHHSNGLGGGWGKEVFWGGPVRVSYSFLAGMTVYRMGWIIKSRIGFLSLSLMLLAALLMPYIAGINQYTDAITVLLYFPFLVSLGAGAQVSPGLAYVSFLAIYHIRCT